MMTWLNTLAQLSVIALLLIVSTVSASADFNVKNYQFAPDAYKDLPGVKAPEDLAKIPEEYTCETTLMYTRNPEGRYRDVFGRRGLPTTGYKCTTKDGQVYYGTANPKARNKHPQVDPYSPL